MKKQAWCPFCSLPLALIARDKNGRPYVTCEGCVTRLFIKTNRGYMGYLKLSEAAGKNSKEGLEKILSDGLQKIKDQEARAEISNGQLIDKKEKAHDSTRGTTESK